MGRSESYISLYQTLVMGTEMIPETAVSFNELTRLIARKYFIKSLFIVKTMQNTDTLSGQNAGF
jgi:hypothetical protein